jgi:hypothetical protein
MQRHDVDCLLMGGQACVLYGAAEFSKDIDFVILADDANLARVQAAMNELQADIIAVPPFDAEHLAAGFAVHFRCRTPRAEGLRVDLMTTLRGVDSFHELRARSTEVALPSGVIRLLSRRDLVAAKKTQRAKDWPMIQRLVEVSYLSDDEGSAEFWLRELRSGEFLIEAVARFPELSKSLAAARPLLGIAAEGNRTALERALMEEMFEEQQRDREHWEPLKAKLGDMRRALRGEV